MIHNLRDSVYLSLAEVQVLAPYNLAAGKVATQSSTSGSAEARYAVDGRTSDTLTHPSTAATTFEAQPWWQVDLGVPMALGKVVLYARNNTLLWRLGDFDVLVSNNGFDWTKAAGYGGVAGNRTVLSVAAEARYVRVQLRGSKPLNLLEVQLFAPPDLALGKTASQSSTSTVASVAGNAVDGSVGPARPVAETTFEEAPWWEVDLGEEMDVATIAVTPGPGLLSNFQVLVSADHEIWSLEKSVPGAITGRTTFQVVTTGRYVRIARLPSPGSTPGSIEYIGLSLAEVEVLPMQNVALGKRASQSSTPDWGGGAAGAVDGNPDGSWYNGSVTHTEWQGSPWWQVDLGPGTFISTVDLHNRTDDSSERLANFVLETSDDGATWTTIESHPGIAGPIARFIPDVFARYLRVRLLGTDYLSLAEVEIHY